MDEYIEVPGLCLIRAECTCFATMEYFVSIQLEREPTLRELRILRREWDLRPSGRYYYINVIASNAQAMRFARFFGFYEIHRHGDLSVQIMEPYYASPNPRG